MPTSAPAVSAMLAGLVIAACCGDAAPRPADTSESPSPPSPSSGPPAVADAGPAPESFETPAVDIEWSMTAGRDALRIDYAVTNRSPTWIAIADRLPGDGVIVMGSHLERAISFRLGFVSPVSADGIPTFPEHRPLEAGATLRRRVRVPLPLRARHPAVPSDRLVALPGDASRAVLELDYVVDSARYGAPKRRVARGPVLPLPDKLARADVTAPAIDWSLEVIGDRLRIDYTVTNSTGAPVYLEDIITSGTSDLPDAAIRVDSELPDTVAFIRGYATVRNVLTDYSEPRRRRLATGGVVRGTALIPLPLEAWHPDVRESEFWVLTPHRPRAVLEIGFRTGLEWPSPRRTARSSVKPLPPAVWPTR